MLNYIQIQDDLKNLSDDQIRTIAVNPANPMHGTLAVGELERRQRMRNDFASRAANPLSTIAEQLVAPQPQPMSPLPTAPGGPPGAPAAGPAAPSPMGQAPVGAPMADGGDVLSTLREYQQLRRSPSLETLGGAMEQARGLMGEDESEGLRALIERYRAGEGGRRQQDITQLLMSMGAAGLSSRRPDFLGGLGDIANAGVESYGDMRDRRTAAEREGITDEGVLARLATDRQGRLLDAGTSLYGMGLEGLDAAAEIESDIMRDDTQRDIANMYSTARTASAASRYQGMNQRELRAALTSATSVLNTATRTYAAIVGDEGVGSPAALTAQQDLMDARANVAAIQEALIGFAPDGGAGPGSTMGTIVGSMNMSPGGSPADSAVDTTNNAQVRPDAQSNVNGIGALQDERAQADPNRGWTVRR